MNILMPDSGLLFWMTISFGIVVFILVKFGFPVILKMLAERKYYIDESLLMADKARSELDLVKADGELIIENAKKEYKKIMNEAAKLKLSLIEDAKVKAKVETQKLIEEARVQILHEKNDAIRDIRSQVAFLSVDIAEKVLREKLNQKTEQQALLNRLIDDITFTQS